MTALARLLLISQNDQSLQHPGRQPLWQHRQPAQRQYVARFDLNNDSFIDVIGDIQKVAGDYGAACGSPTTGP